MSERTSNSPESNVSPETLQIFRNLIEARAKTLTVVTPENEPMFSGYRREIYRGSQDINDSTQLIPVDRLEYTYSKWYDTEDSDEASEVWSVSVGLADNEPYFSIVLSGDDIRSETGDVEVYEGEIEETFLQDFITNLETGEKAGTITATS